MEPSCIRQTELPNVSRLFSDFIYHPDRVAEFYPYLPLSVESLRRSAQAIQFPAERRRKLIEALSVHNAGNPLLDVLAQPDTVAVVTGQQVGLFSGPPYTIYKALTAIRLARQLTESGTPAVPMFWLATEDHDLDEVNQAWVFNAAYEPVRFSAQARPHPNQPVGGITLEQVPLDELRRTLEGLPFADEAFALVRDAYQPGVSFGDAFRATLDRLFRDFPILRVDPMLPEFRALAAPLLRDAVLRAPELTTEIRERDRQLVAAGYHAQVHVEDSTSFFFLLRNGERLALKRQNGGYLAGKEKFSTAELADRAQDLSPNALLRPVVQDSMIPTVAYVGGPAELAYLAQSEVLYRNLLGYQPAALHRAGFTLLNSRAAKLMDRYRLALPDFFHGEEALRIRAARTLVDPQLVSKIADARTSAVGSLHRMSSDLSTFDPSITKALEKSWRKIEYQFDKIDRKVHREAVARDQRAMSDITFLTNFIYPRHKLQERLYSTVALVAQFGPDLVSRIYDHVTLDCPDHQLLEI